ncbi:DUF5916 domain-containing protein [Sunxiuqinia dokdonensis]|uniref:DUF5916 domain-containing protein n=1 Tax=Sunxiuqinia dokdonensis TaxID=1409788 RepID=A0A0L8V6N2_9BACT|nr:DUF5916 domain-containing protein [Sunxiuqinia dokdonensis]KOH43857.1 hypothetical protein NC99_33530 [Sunxiuqinia dokdonensis]
MKNLFLLMAFVLVLAGAVSGMENHQPDSVQQTFNKDFVLHVKKTTGPIHIDGKLDEPDWVRAEKANNFFRVLPVDTGLADAKSEVVMTYNDQAFYLAFTFFDSSPGKRIMESFRRDFVFGNNDNFLVFFDTFLDQTNGFSFGTSASGAKWDGIMHDGSAVNLNWDCKWESKTVHYDDRWVTEMRIPFRSIRFKSGTDRWYVNFSRLDLKMNEKSSWAPVPRQFPTASLAYTGVLDWEEPLPKSKTMFSLIPYVYGSVAKNYEAGSKTDYQKDVGFDAKIGVTTSMNLDLTYNPDFAQAEVDQQVTNLDRFELLFPEKRQFFLENSDLFAGFGYDVVTPFFSRRIGLDAPVLFGARLSGKLNNNWRLGLMDMQTEKTADLPGRNFAVASVQRKLFARSSAGLIVVNKENIDEPGGAQDFNRVLGLDYNLASSNNAWNGKFFYHHSFDEDEHEGGQYAQGAHLEYKTRNIGISFAQTSVGTDYNAEVGFVRRKGYNFLGPSFSYTWVPNKKIVAHGVFAESENFYDTEFRKIDHEQTVGYNFEFKSRATAQIGWLDFYVHLLEDFDPTHKNDVYLPAGSEYRYGGAWVEYASDNRKNLKWSGSYTKGTFYNGHIDLVEGMLGYRFQPYVNFTLNMSYNSIRLPQPFETTDLWLIGPKMDITFSDKVFLSTFVQYNEQIDNMNVNLRFQWRYAPVSDFFVVYTDNYFTGDWASRNRALVVKLSYWLN